MKLTDIKIIITEDKDLSELYPHQIKEIKSHVKKGAKDLDRKWKNALELVHFAYSEANIERPNPTMSAGWAIYEDIIQNAVDELSKIRGFDADWRTTEVDYPS